MFNLAGHFTHTTVSVIIHLLVLFIFLSFLFWFIISKAEKRALNREIDHGINHIKIALPDTIINKTVYDNLLSMYSKESPLIKISNDRLLMYNIGVIIFFIILLILIILVLHFSCNKSLNFKEIIIENIFILSIVGLLEYLFFKTVASNYVPIKPSLIPNILKDQIKQKLN